MIDKLIHEAANLMEQQASDYEQLDATCAQLTEALIDGDASLVESRTRAGELILRQVRARLVQVIRTVTGFADARAQAPDGGPLNPAARTEFETASQRLLRAAGAF